MDGKNYDSDIIHRDSDDIMTELVNQERLTLTRTHPPVPLLNSVRAQRVDADHRHDYALNWLLLAAKKNLAHMRDTQHEEEVDRWSLRLWAAPVWDRSAGVYVTRREEEFKEWYQEVGMAVGAAASPSLREAKTLSGRHREMMELHHDEEKRRENRDKFYSASRILLKLWVRSSKEPSKRPKKQSTSPPTRPKLTLSQTTTRLPPQQRWCVGPTKSRSRTRCVR